MARHVLDPVVQALRLFDEVVRGIVETESLVSKRRAVADVCFGARRRTQLRHPAMS